MLPIHQDLQVVDEQQYLTVHTWLPLVDVYESNGCLTIVPGSHGWVNHPRAFGDKLEQSVFKNVIPLLTERFQRSAPLKAGHALFYHGRTMHGSYGNATAQPRIATISDCPPAEAPVWFHYRSSKTQVERFEIDEDFFWRDDFHWSGQRPAASASLRCRQHP